MACKTSYDLHHNFPRLAEETGFAFNTHRPRVHIDWNKIRLIDIESLARDRKFILIEQHVNDILDCVLESEFDVRILDEGVVKLFRLAQLAVEYQQFCRHYLDRSVFVLRQEIDTLAQDLATTKKDLQEKEEELRKLRRKGKHNYRPLIPYGNENIATMILKTLTNKGDIFPSAGSGEIPQYNKCNICDKVFLNQLYLKSHISRRHVNILDEIPQKDEKETRENNIGNVGHENEKFNEEINGLKLKIQEMEHLITANNTAKKDSEQLKKDNALIVAATSKEMKDAEVATNNEHVFEKLEEWKKTEQEKHAQEINLLRNQIFETLNSFREKEVKKSDDGELKVIEHLHVTIREQGAEILALKQALTNTKLKTENEEKKLNKEVADQMLSWAKRDEEQTKQYEVLIQKLNEVAKEARESRVMAEAERQRAEKLETLLNERQNHSMELDRAEEGNNSTDADVVSSSQEEFNNTTRNGGSKVSSKPRPVVDHNTLEKLHRKAQELLNMKSSSSSDTSNAENINNQQTLSFNKSSALNSDTKTRHTKNLSRHPEEDFASGKANKLANKSKASNKLNPEKLRLKKKKPKKEPPQASPRIIITQGNGPILPPGRSATLVVENSPLKVVRAKITEEVNSRLVAAGVDPLKSRLHQSIYQKQKYQLQQQQELKSKKHPSYEQVRYTIMANLDADASVAKRNGVYEQENAIPNALTKPFSLSSVISNVKSKALSLVKSKETKRKSGHKTLNSDVAKKAVSLLKTPPGSPMNSNIQRSSPNLQHEKVVVLNTRHKSESSVLNIDESTRTRPDKSSPSLVDGDSDSNESNNAYNVTIPQRPSRSIDNLIKSPARRPASATADYNNTVLKYAISNDHLGRTQSVTNVSDYVTYQSERNDLITEHTAASNDDIQALLNVSKQPKADDVKRNSLVHTKGVLKNASSTSSLNKKKVIFDMDAIQMKSVSASPSQSLTEKSDDRNDFGLENIGNDEWDISSIENEPLNNDTKISVRSGPRLKVAELKQTIEAQLARRSDTPSTALFGGVDVLRGPISRASNVGGSNTSLGSSILDESDTQKFVNQKGMIKPKTIAEKDDSELDISDFSIDGVTNRNERDSF